LFGGANFQIWIRSSGGKLGKSVNVGAAAVTRVEDALDAGVSR